MTYKYYGHVYNQLRYSQTIIQCKHNILKSVNRRLNIHLIILNMSEVFSWVILTIIYLNYFSTRCQNIQIAPIKQLLIDSSRIKGPLIRKIKQNRNRQIQNGSRTKQAKNQLTKQVMELIYKQNELKIKTQSLKKVKKYIVSNQFKEIGLYHSVPTNLVEGEVYRFFGTVLNQALITSEGYNFVNIVFSQLHSKNQFRCIQRITQSLQFDISCRMQISGLFFLSIFAGIQGQSSPKLRNIRSYHLFEAVQRNVIAPEPNNARLQLKNNRLFIIWDSIASLTNLTIYQQKGNKKQYLLSNFHEKFEIPLADFYTFKTKQKTLIQISHAQSLDGTLSLKYTKYSQFLIRIQFISQNHLFDDIIEGIVQWQAQLPWQMDIGQKFILNLTFKQDVKNQVLIIYPDLSIKALYFIQPLINMPAVVKANNWVQLQLTFRLPGLHLIQINSISGIAIINRPIYVGQTFPLIPDYIDLQPLAYNPIKNVSLLDLYHAYYQKTTAKLTMKQPSFNSSLLQKTMYVLQILNGLRAKYQLDLLELDQQLGKIAQKHADSMRNSNYFSHLSPNGDGPRERARKMGFTGSVGQNIAKASYLTEAHLGLQRSASHLQNIISQLWSRVGIGISHTQDQQYIIVFQFSMRDLNKYPLTSQQKQKIQIDFMDLVRQQNPSIIKYDNELSSDIKSWIESDRTIKIYEYLMQKSNRRSQRPMIGTSFTLSYSKDWPIRLRNSNYLSGFKEFQEVGIGIDYSQVDKNNVEIYILFA